MPTANTSPAIPALTKVGPYTAWNVALQHMTRAVTALDGGKPADIVIPTHDEKQYDLEFAQANGKLINDLVAKHAPPRFDQVPAVRTSSAASDAIRASNILRDASYTNFFNEDRSIMARPLLAQAAGKLSTAPNDDAVRSARALLLEAAQKYDVESP